MTQGKTYYTPGLVFKAKQGALGHQEVCRRFVPAVYTPDGAGIVREEIPELLAEFGVWGSEFTYEDPLTGMTEVGSDFRGGFFDLDTQAEQKGWGPTEKEIVARHMLTLPPNRAMFYLLAKAPAAKPWPSYDEMHHKQVVPFAVQAGLVAEALAYEQDTLNRPSVVDGLRESLVEDQRAAEADADSVEELTVA